MIIILLTCASVFTDASDSGVADSFVYQLPDVDVASLADAAEPVMSSRSRKSRSVPGTCRDYSAISWFDQKVDTLGLPDNTVALPIGLNQQELHQLHDHCVAQINRYRTGDLKFKDGESDPDIPVPVTQLRPGSNRCATASALGDLDINLRNGGGCAGAHANSFVCPWSRRVGQNSCCGRGGGSWGNWDSTQYDTFEKIKGSLDNCLQSMWDEGVTDGQKGHWLTMKNPLFTHVSCGFAFAENGRVFMTQDFYASDTSDASPTCSDGSGTVTITDQDVDYAGKTLRSMVKTPKKRTHLENLLLDDTIDAVTKQNIRAALAHVDPNAIKWKHARKFRLP